MEPVEEEISHLLPVMAVAEPSEYEYGAEVFEAAYPAIKQEKILEAKAPFVLKTEKSRWWYDGQREKVLVIFSKRKWEDRILRAVLKVCV